MQRRPVMGRRGPRFENKSAPRDWGRAQRGQDAPWERGSSLSWRPAQCRESCVGRAGMAAVARVLPSQMPTLRRKVRILIERTWAMFFSNDITHLRFTRSSRRRSITRVQKDGVSYKRKSARLTEEREP